MKNLQNAKPKIHEVEIKPSMHLENCTGKMKRKDENVKIQSRPKSGSDAAKTRSR